MQDVKIELMQKIADKDLELLEEVDKVQKLEKDIENLRRELIEKALNDAGQRKKIGKNILG